MTRKMMLPVLLGGLLLGVPSCKNLTSPNDNFGDLEEITSTPTRISVNTLALGLLFGQRVYMRNPNDYVSILGVLGRESYNNDIADPRFHDELLIGPLDPSSPAFGGNYWDEPYENIRLGQITLDGVDQLDDLQMSPGEREFIRGFVKTINAIDFLVLVNTRDTNCGCPITLPDDPQSPTEQVSKEQVFAHIVSLLEEAKAHLQGASDAPLTLPSGFDGFTTAAGFLEFNRAIRARVAVYTMDFSTALQALSESFLDTSAPLALGVFHSFSSQSGDELNQLFDPSDGPRLKAHPSIKQDVELKAGGTPDQRFTDKTRVIRNVTTFGLCLGVPPGTPAWPPDPRFVDLVPGNDFATQSCDVGFEIYTSITAPIPLIRNEELILLRAEANIGLGILAAAESDINFVRTTAGGLEPVALTPGNALERLLYEKQFSLLWEGGHRWIDLRRYDMLDILVVDHPPHTINVRYPVPLDEQAARN
jgi:hypothetical protein